MFIQYYTYYFFLNVLIIVNQKAVILRAIGFLM